LALLLPGGAGAGDVGRVVFGADADYPPFEWTSDGQRHGFIHDIERAMAATDDTRAVYRSGPWPEMIEALRAGRIDVLAMLASSARREEFALSDPFHFVRHAAYGREQSASMDGVSDLRGVRIAVVPGSVAEGELRRHLDDVELVHADSTLEALRMAASGEADYAVSAVAAAEHAIAAHGLAVGRKSPPLWSLAYVFAVRRERSGLADWVDGAFDRVVATGGYNDIYALWDGRLEQGDTEWTQTLRTVGWFAGPIMGLALLAFGWSWSLRRQVSARTGELRAALARREAAEREVQHLARHEVETGLPHRVYFLELVDGALDDAPADASLDLVVLQVVDLGEVTRTFGHAAGQELVGQLAARLGGMELQATGYFGGRTFAAAVATGRTAALIEALAATVRLPDIELDPLVIGGVARFPDHGTAATELLRRAETALAACEHKRGQHRLYDPALEPDPVDLRIVRDFRRSGGGGTYALYQPQMDLADARCRSCEALVRWEHPELGAMSPGRFVPLLERTGLVTELTRHMVDAAAQRASALRRAGRPARVSVNVSSYDMRETDLVRLVAAALDRHATQPGDLCVELTETALAADESQVRGMLERLRRLGVASSIDDFGTGYASLAYLAAFPVDEIKIDRLFVRGLLSERRHRAIVQATLTMARQLGLEVVAEGVEDEATLEALRELGCDRAQGFLFARPMHAAELDAYLERTPASTA